MKTIILCGGRGTRLGEHGAAIPKALIEIGERPVLWHLLKIYAHHGLNDFILCLGYLGDAIKRYFLEHHWIYSDFTLEMSKTGDYRLHIQEAVTEDWRITFVETGLDTNTGGRVKRIEKYIGDDETFCVTYGDGLANIDLPGLIRFHQSHGRIATLTGVHPRSNFGFLQLNEDNAVTEFTEKPEMKEWINGGFFVFNRAVFDYLTDDCVLEREPLERLAHARELMAYRHNGFWKCMDTYKDNIEFNQLWDAGRAEWKVWV
ncbi:MAG: glucose-1-phosphate cytidylyltransferase [Acidobacteria bacterium]|nr:glucose-1-phosphate cytidylyltransferase [Acidobacteriota bacterium]